MLVWYCVVIAIVFVGLIAFFVIRELLDRRRYKKLCSPDKTQKTEKVENLQEEKEEKIEAELEDFSLENKNVSMESFLHPFGKRKREFDDLDDYDDFHMKKFERKPVEEIEEEDDDDFDIDFEDFDDETKMVDRFKSYDDFNFDEVEDKKMDEILEMLNEYSPNVRKMILDDILKRRNVDDEDL